MSSTSSNAGPETRVAAICRALESYLPHYDSIIASRPAIAAASCHQAILDSELQAMDLSATLLRRRRNALSPVNCLHPEILTSIFAYLVDLEPPVSGYKYQNKLRTLGWVRITHVCNLWRTVALDDPRLWSCITFTFGGSWVEESVRRSAACPLRLRLSYGDKYPQAFGPTLQHYANRIEAVDINKPDPNGVEGCPEELYQWIISPNPVICSFTCRGLSLGRTKTWPPLLFAGKALNLKHLCIEGHLPKPFEMIRPLLCHLTSLSLRYGSAKSSLRELYEFLSRAMGLQTLAIRGYAWSSGKDELADLGILHFPKLRIYHVEGTLSDSTTFFCLLQLPLACRVTIECGLQRRDDFSREMPRLASVITRQGGPFSEILTLEVASRSVPMKCFTMSGWRQDSSTFLMEDFTQDGLPRSVARDEPHCMIIFQGIQAQITGRVSLAVFAPQVSALFDLLPIKQLQNLSFRSSALEYNYMNWGHLSRECVDLNFLRIDKNIIHSFVENAAFSRPYRAPPSVTQIVFLNVHSGSQHSVDMEVIGSVLRDCGNTALTTVVFDGYKPQDLQELLPDLRLQHVQRVLKGDSEDRAALRTNRLSRLGA